MTAHQRQARVRGAIANQAARVDGRGNSGLNLQKRSVSRNANPSGIDPIWNRREWAVARAGATTPGRLQGNQMLLEAMDKSSPYRREGDVAVGRY